MVELLLLFPVITSSPHRKKCVHLLYIQPLCIFSFVVSVLSKRPNTRWLLKSVPGHSLPEYKITLSDTFNFQY